MLILLLALTISWILAAPATAAPGGSAFLDAARTIAENILGAGQVRALRASDDASELFIRWESPTFRRDNPAGTNRELMYGEAVLATNAILGQLHQVARIRFTILAGGGAMLATGDTVRARGVVLQFSPELGGGMYTPSAPARVDHGPAIGRPAQEI